jgi:hypothetical protein
MTTGRRAFEGDSTVAILGCVLRDEPKAIRDIRRDTPADLERLICRCLRKNPERRVQTMSDLKTALSELKHESDADVLVPVSQLRRRNALLVWTAIAIVACAIILLAANRFNNLYVVFGWIAPGDCRAGKWRDRVDSGVGFRLVDGFPF